MRAAPRRRVRADPGGGGRDAAGRPERPARRRAGPPGGPALAQLLSKTEQNAGGVAHHPPARPARGGDALCRQRAPPRRQGSMPSAGRSFKLDFGIAFSTLPPKQRGPGRCRRRAAPPRSRAARAGGRQRAQATGRGDLQRDRHRQGGGEGQLTEGNADVPRPFDRTDHEQTGPSEAAAEVKVEPGLLYQVGRHVLLPHGGHQRRATTHAPAPSQSVNRSGVVC